MDRRHLWSLAGVFVITVGPRINTQGFYGFLSTYPKERGRPWSSLEFVQHDILADD
jgi:hypothetical protein